MTAAKLPRDVTTLIERTGLAVVSFVGNRHWKVRARAPDGREKVFAIAKTSSDHRAEKNKTAQLRKFARGEK